MAWFDTRAAKLQRDVKWDEAKQVTDHSAQELRQAIIHTRQDVVLLVSHLSSLNQQVGCLVSLVGVLVIAVVGLILGWWHLG